MKFGILDILLITQHIYYLTFRYTYLSLSYANMHTKSTSLSANHSLEPTVRRLKSVTCSSFSNFEVLPAVFAIAMKQHAQLGDKINVVCH